MIYLSQQVRPYPACCQCKERGQYPYYGGSDGHYYCEDCSQALVKEKQGEYGGKHREVKPHKCARFKYPVKSEVKMVTQTEKERRMEFARGRAAQAWCVKSTENKVMDVELAEAFAEILVIEMYEPRLGCATTGQLLDELSARSNLDYKTVSDGEGS